MAIGKFSLAAPRMIRFGNGTFSQIPSALSELRAAQRAVSVVDERTAGEGCRALIVCGSSRRFIDELESYVEAAGIDSTVFPISGEPDLGLVDRGVQVAREFSAEMVIAIGGGSALDGAKAIAALCPNEGPALDYLEVVGAGKPLKRPPLPVLAIPTTSGTGSEVTKNAVLSVPEKQVKVSLRDPGMIPASVIVDPALTLNLPPAISAATGMDALTQLIEPWVSPMATPMTDGFCREGIPRAARALPKVCTDPGDIEAREDMALASLLGGLALANAKLGAVHGFAGPIGGMFPAAHGSICAALLPAVMEVNFEALNRQTGNDPIINTALQRYLALGPMLCGNPSADAKDAIDMVRTLAGNLNIPGLGALGVDNRRIDEIISKAKGASSMKGNPLALEDDQLRRILELSW
jgi:alcohol dehydrogenase class IV